MVQQAASGASTAIVAKILAMVSGRRPRNHAEALIDPQVIIHMDTMTHHGIELWHRWVYLIRNAGRRRDLRFIVLDIKSDAVEPTTVTVAGRWSGRSKFSESSRTLSELVYFRYRLENDRAIELWTKRSNYAFVLGNWITVGVFYRLFLAWLFFYFWWLSRQHVDFRIDRIR